MAARGGDEGEWSPVALFGGAITTVLPPGFLDASKFRQVPDHQEVFVAAEGADSIIVEIMERVEDDDMGGVNPGQYYFHDLATSNDATHARVLDCDRVSMAAAPFLLGPSVDARGADADVWLVRGVQHVAKFRASAGTESGHDVTIHLAVIRLPRVNTDILITWNAPPREVGGVGSGVVPSLGGMDTLAAFSRLVQSFHIREFGLFGG